MTAFAPLTGIHPNQAKEQFSSAVVRGVCAQAGLNCSKPEVDHGIDLVIAANEPLEDSPEFACNITIRLQIKSTTVYDINNDVIKYRLRRNNYNVLRRPNVYSPSYLILFLLPNDPAQWIVPHDQSTLFSLSPYWFSLDGFPEEPDGLGPATPVPLDIPVAQRLDASSLQELYRSAGLKLMGGR